MKDKLIVLIVLVLLLSAAGFFYFWQNRPTPPDDWGTAETSLREDYQVQELAEGRIVKNDKAGISFEVPEDWIVEEKQDYYNDLFFLYSPDMNAENSVLFLNQGCKIEVMVSNIKTNIDVLEQEQKDNALLPEFHKFSRIELSGYQAVKDVFLKNDNEGLQIYEIGVFVPAKDKMYDLILTGALKDQGKCETEFDKFLEGVKIK